MFALFFICAHATYTVVAVVVVCMLVGCARHNAWGCNCVIFSLCSDGRVAIVAARVAHTYTHIYMYIHVCSGVCTLSF